MCRGKLWLFFTLIGFLQVTVIKCWSHVEEKAENPRHPGKCYNSQYDLYIKPGHTVGGYRHNDRRFCKKMTCARLDDGEMNLIYTECPFEDADPAPNCKLVRADKEKPFPDCCAYVKCVEEYHGTSDDFGGRIYESRRVPYNDDDGARSIDGAESRRVPYDDYNDRDRAIRRPHRVPSDDDGNRVIRRPHRVPSDDDGDRVNHDFHRDPYEDGSRRVPYDDGGRIIGGSRTSDYDRYNSN